MVPERELPPGLKQREHHSSAQWLCRAAEILAGREQQRLIRAAVVPSAYAGPDRHDDRGGGD
jgi:hypothetical protein